ncbi:MAG: CDP-alcohol phosphatidyltransferase family protein [Gemmatimonas sp.]
MSDFAFGVVPWAVVLGALLVYTIRVLLTGRAKSARADADGGSVLLSKHFIEFAMWMLMPVGRLVVRMGGSSDGVTWFSVLPGVGAGVALAFGRFGLATLLGTIASFCDSLDGMVARLTGMGSEAGETLDAMIDRYAESAFFVGLLLHYRESFLITAFVATAMVGAFMVSYTSAKAEAQHVAPPRGLMRRSERATYLLAGSGLTPFSNALLPASAPLMERDAPMLLAIGLIAIISNFSTFRRVGLIREALRAKNKP